MGSDGGAWAMDPATALQTGFVPQGIGADLIATIEGWSRADVDAYRRRVAPPRRHGVGQRLLRRLRRAGARPVRVTVSTATRRTPRHLRRGPRRAQAVVRADGPRRRLRRRRARESTTGCPRSTTSTTPATPPASSTAPRSWRSAPRRSAPRSASRPAPDHLHRRLRRRPDDHAHRPRARRPQGARPRRARGRRHRPVEINEAFAAVAMRFMRDMGISHDVTNVNGGAIAMATRSARPAR